MSTIFNNIAMRGYDILEEESFRANIVRLDAAVNDLLKKDQKLLVDWAEWDDMYNYIHYPYEGFVDSNISPSFMFDQSIDFILIFDPEDQVLVSYQYNKGEMIEVYEPRLIETVVKHKNENRIMLHNGRPLIIATSEITDTKEFAPKEGLLCFAYYLDHGLIKSIEEDLELDFKLVSSSEKFDPDDDHILVFDHGTYNTALFKYGYVNDPHGIALQFKHPLSITALGQKTMYEVLWVSFIAFVIISTILFVVVRAFLDRIHSLSRDVDRIAHEQDLSLRVKEKSKDEIGLLTKDINMMLDRIENMNEQLMEHASTDMLTGVHNRRVGFERLESLLKGFDPESSTLTICYIDINNLKVVNDTLGHNCGDDLIKTVSQTIQSSLNAEELICRLGGDEFLVIFPNQDIEQARLTLIEAEKNLLLKQVENNKKYPISISKGFLTYDGQMSIQDFVEKADKYMYEDKKSKKRNRRSD